MTDTMTQHDQFDPEDPKVWEQADKELKAAAETRDAFGPHPVMKAICSLVLLTAGGIVLGVIVLFLRNLLSL